MKMSRLPVGALICAVTLAMLPLATNAQRRERAGAEVVDAVCASCHAKGDKGAPKIGDQRAWAKRASRGLIPFLIHW